MESMAFTKGHRLNIGNQYAKGCKHSEEWKMMMSKKMKGNTNGFTKGCTSPRKGKKTNKPSVLKGKKRPEFSGENHPNWISDRSKIKRQNRKDNPKYKRWRMEVYTRDNWKCRLANSKCKGRIEAHHIYSWLEYPKLRYEINNGITLCHFHHPRKKEDVIKKASTFFKIIDSTIPYSVEI